MSEDVTLGCQKNETRVTKEGKIIRTARQYCLDGQLARDGAVVGFVGWVPLAQPLISFSVRVTMAMVHVGMLLALD